MTTSNALFSIQDWSQKTEDLGVDVSSVSTALERVYEAQQSNTLPVFFDRLSELSDKCQALKNGNEESLKLVNYLNTLREQAYFFIKTILDVKTDEEAEELIAKREKLKETDPNYVPFPRPLSAPEPNGKETRSVYRWRYAKKIATQIVKKGILLTNEDTESEVSDPKHEGVQYLDEIEREKYRVFISDRKLVKIILNDKDKDPTLQVVDFDTKDEVAHGNKNRSIFIITPLGDLFFGSTFYNKEYLDLKGDEVKEDSPSLKDGLCFFHTSFTSADATLWPGASIVTDGYIEAINDHSGHYWPQVMNAQNGISYLIYRDAITPSTTVGLYSEENSYVEWGLNVGQYDWKTDSNTGMFHIRNSLLRKIDTCVKRHKHSKFVNDLTLQVEALDDLMVLLERYESDYPFCVRMSRIRDLKDRVIFERLTVKRKLCQTQSNTDLSTKKRIMSNEIWKTLSYAGFFSVRSYLLKKLDNELKYYHKNRESHTDEQNVEQLQRMLVLIDSWQGGLLSKVEKQVKDYYSKEDVKDDNKNVKHLKAMIKLIVGVHSNPSANARKDAIESLRFQIKGELKWFQRRLATQKKAEPYIMSRETWGTVSYVSFFNQRESHLKCVDKGLSSFHKTKDSNTPLENSNILKGILRNIKDVKYNFHNSKRSHVIEKLEEQINTEVEWLQNAF